MNLNKTKCLICMKKTSDFQIVTVEPQKFCTFQARREGKEGGQEVRVLSSHHSSLPGGSSFILFLSFIY